MKSFLLIYSIILMTLCIFILPCNDSYYYWEWSQNLQLSYFDGPPLIAYVIKLATLIFGNSTFAINFTGVVVALITVYVIFKIGEILSNKLTGLVIGLFWLTYPFTVTRYIFINVTYDCLENLFSLTTILFAIRYIKFRRVVNLYYLGVFAGFFLLSKYSGVIVLFGIIIYFSIVEDLRHVFREKHIYVAILICIFIFMPVIIWNYQNNWISFIFQLKHHVWGNQALINHDIDRHGINGVIFYVFSGILGPMLILFLLLIFMNLKNQLINTIKNESNENRAIIKFLVILIITIFIFWLPLSYFVRVNLIYMLNLSSILIIITCYFLLKNKYNKTILILILLFSIYSTGMMIKNCYKINDPINYNKYIINKKLKRF